MNTWDCTVVRQDGTEYPLEDAEIIVTGFTVDAPTPITTKENIEGRNGFIDEGTVYDGRTLHLTIVTKPVDRPDVMLFRNQVFRIFDSREYFYLINSGEPGKRWRVKYDSAFSLQQFVQGSKEETGSIDLISDSPCAESISSTGVDPPSMDSDGYQMVDGGLPLDEDISYSQSSSEFNIYNGGDIEVDPRERYLLIQFQGASNNLTITNKTNGYVFKFNGSTGSSDVLTINQTIVELNGTDVFGQTNYGLIRLEPGDNDITVLGTTGAFTIVFDFHFPYLY